MQRITHNLKRINRLSKTLAGLILVFILAACAPAAGKLPEAALPQPSATAVVTPTPAATATPSPTPTPEIAEPSIPHGLLPENAAEQIVENDTWVVKNASGEITATWDEKTKEWTYHRENIKVSYTKIGFEPDDPSFLAPLLEPLPPDDPSTHFIDPATGKPVPYGIGPETQIALRFSGVENSIASPETEVFVRFRGVAQIPQREGFHAAVFEIPHSPDRTTLITQLYYSKNFFFVGIPDETIIFDFETMLYENQRDRDAYVQQLNENYSGNMVMLLIGHDYTHMIKSATYYEDYVREEEYASAFLRYLSEESIAIPSYGFEDLAVFQFMGNLIVVPENQFVHDFD